MPKIRHIAYRANDVEAMANFFASSFEMEITQRRKNGAIDLSDGTINITVLPARAGRQEGEPARTGIDHIGFTVEDEAESSRILEANGAKKIATLELGSSAHYEVKYQGPEGIIVDLGHWAGAAPIESEAAAAAEKRRQA
ncbi:MAG TPA: VOC family protein [Candidatus Acidoferrales bacterium]|nr:VOC family protein [Candidatus Acidoferrales bacterium]